MNDEPAALKDGFTWSEKLAARAGLALLVGIGTLAIGRGDPRWAVAYLLFVAAAGLAVVYDALCVYCPYPFQHSDCLFFPYPLVARLTTLRTGPMPRSRKLVSALAFVGIVAVPQYGLWGQWLLFAAFWAMTLAGGLAVPRHFCRRCRHRRCPMNLAPPQAEGLQ